MNKKKILVLGSGGMLGHVVYTYLNELNKYELSNSSYPKSFNSQSILLDATDKLQIEKTIENIKPDVLINCIGILIKGSQQDPSNAIYLNSFLPHQLSKLQHKHGGRLIHISTDCVFSGKKGGYKEDDVKDAYDMYGLSKALGEVKNSTDLTFRTSIVGPELKENGEGLLHWFFSQSGEINGFINSYWTGVTTLFLASAIDIAINENLSGLYHVTNNAKISKYDLLSLAKKVWKKDNVTIRRLDGVLVDKSLINTRKDKFIAVPNYEEMFFELKNFMDMHISTYGHYKF
jgi:dTDP-4-dehydrorhamnose reductase